MILDELKASTLRRVEKSKEIKPMSLLEAELEKRPQRPDFSFENELKKPGMSYICEVKKASPSKGIIAEDFPYIDIAREYEAAGASCISVLTEPEYFKGDIAYLRSIRDEVKIPLLRKDFTCDEYMVTEASVNGADAVLLIAAILEDAQMKSYLKLADDLKLSAIFEAHDEEEIKRCVQCGARIIGVNNRDLKDFKVDINNSKRLRKLVPKEILFVAESGIKTNEDIKALKDYGVDAVLIGETLMRAKDKAGMLKRLNGEEPES